MSSPFLTSKLFIPSLRPKLVPRPTLNERLNAGLRGNLTLVSAPAGFGKTTMVSFWARSISRPVLWLTLDENDNDLTGFLNSLIASLSQIIRGFGVDILAAIDSSQSPQVEILLTMLVNEMTTIEGEIILVLDDIHLITSQLIIDALEFITHHLPPELHLVIISRIDPPFPLSRLRAGGQLTEFRSIDLRFSEEEVAVFLNDLMGLELSQEDIRALEKRTEGWVVGLHLAALSLQGRDQKHEFVKDFSGSHHYIIDYLMEEVLTQQSEEIRSFLCRSSILERLNPALCDAVLEIDSSRRILQQLLDTNLFLIPLDDQRLWYRYHHLFSDFLLQCLEENEPEQLAGLHRRAASWFEVEGITAEAVRHALAGKDFPMAARLVEDIAAHMLARSELAALMRLVDSLPREETNTRPWLIILHTWALRLSGRPYDVVEARLDDADRAITIHKQALSGAGTDTVGQTDSAELTRLECHIKALRAYQALYREDIPQVIELARQVQDCCPEEHFLCSSTALALGWAYRFSGDLEAAAQEFSEATTLASQAGNIYLAVATQCRAAYALVLAGKLGQALAYLQAAEKIATTKDGRHLPVAGYAQVYIGGILYEQNQLVTAEKYLLEGIRHCERVGYIMDHAVGCIYLARLRIAENDLAAARAALLKAEALSRKMQGYLYMQRWVEDGKLRLWVAEGELAAVQQWVQGSDLNLDDPFNFMRDIDHIILARALVALGRGNPGNGHTDHALLLLEKLLGMAEDSGWMGKAIEILALQSMALQTKGAHQKALSALERALAIGEPEGYVHTFLAEGQPMASMLRRAITEGTSTQYARKLLAVYAAETQAVIAGRERPPFPGAYDPLSKREQDVLKYLASDLTGPEIARELSIALSTLRFHSGNIYSKLAVHNRRSAVRRARELNLI